MSDADDIVRKAREISARADQIADDATDTAALREELDRLDAELARLDDEQRRLDEELRDHGGAKTTVLDEDASATSTHRAGWADTLADIVSDVSEKITSIGQSGWPWNSSESVERTVAVEGPMGVVIENRAGSIKVQSGATTEVHVAAELFAPSSGLVEEMTLTAERVGDEVVIKCMWPENRRGRRAKLTVTVPSGSSVRATTAGGSVSVDETHGAATLSTRGGSVTATGTSGALDARTAGGSIRVSDHAGSVHAVTMGGSVHLGGVLTGDVEASTAGGSVHVDGVDRGTVVASTSGGSIHVRGRLVGHSKIRTAGGSISVSIPSDSQLHVDAKASSCGTDFDGLQSHRTRLEGTLGDGSDGTIEVRTSGGSINLKKT